MDAVVDPDATLMLACAHGDLAAFETLYVTHRGMLYRFLLRSVRDPHRTDELFQETWSRVIDARLCYQPQAKFSTWLLQIAHNLMIDGLRRQRPMAGSDEAEVLLAQLASPDCEQPDHALSEFERRRDLQRAIEQLPHEQRTVMLLRLEQELNLQEIAAVTGAGRETVKSRLRYAMIRLREVQSEWPRRCRQPTRPPRTTSCPAKPSWPLYIVSCRRTSLAPRWMPPCCAPQRRHWKAVMTRRGRTTQETPRIRRLGTSEAAFRHRRARDPVHRLCRPHAAPTRDALAGWAG